MKDVFQNFEEIKNRNIVRQEWLASNKRMLMAYVDAHPHATLARTHLFRFAPAMLAAILLFVTGGVSLASQRSVPGEFLYSWKVGVVENVESAFVVGSQDRAEFEVGRTTKRLQEVTELSARKTSDPKVIAQARERLQSQITVASATIDVAASSDKEQALQTAVKLNATLEAHKTVLTTLVENADVAAKPALQDTISSLKTPTTEIQNTIETIKEQQKQDSATKPKEDLKVAAETKLKANQDSLDTVWGSIVALDEASDLRLKAEELLNAAQEALLSAKDEYDAEAFADALEDIQSATQLIGEAKVFIETSPVPSASPSPQASPTPTASPLASPALDVVE